MTERYDVAVIGSGFSGSILAWILATEGVRVALIDPAIHPRFAIGESSTPIADMVLRQLGQKYGLEELQSLSTWGGWQQHHPDLACGLKRGFSYYQHHRDQLFKEQNLGERSLLVAASRSDLVADTHWYRPDVDRFFFLRAIEAGVSDRSGCAVVAHQNSHGQSLLSCAGKQSFTLLTDWVIDASGAAGVLAKLHRLRNRCGELQTDTHSVFAHYRGVGSWTAATRPYGGDSGADPFDGDDAAQHHLLDRGWLWMLRFNNGITSVGYTAPRSAPLRWEGYRSLDPLFQSASLVAPQAGPVRTQRLQRLFDPVVDVRCLMLPTAAVTLDPLHSTGIAHALVGVARLAEIITESNPTAREELISRYGRAVLEETRLLDRLVSTAYATMADFRRFAAACMLYFAAAIRCEERYQRGPSPAQLWNSDDPEFLAMVDWACQRLLRPGKFTAEEEIRQRLAPWNSAALMDPTVGNRYAYTATKT